MFRNTLLSLTVLLVEVNNTLGTNESPMIRLSERTLMREGAPIDTLFHCDFGKNGAKNCSISTSKCSPTLTNKNSTTGGVLYPMISNDYYMHADATNAAKAQASFNCQWVDYYVIHGHMQLYIIFILYNTKAPVSQGDTWCFDNTYYWVLWEAYVYLCKWIKPKMFSEWKSIYIK